MPCSDLMLRSEMASTPRLAFSLHTVPPTRTDIAKALREAEPKLAWIIDDAGLPPARRREPQAAHFERLATAILHQQLGGPAATTITRRATLALGGTLSAEAVLEADPGLLRSSGVSGAKVAALTDLSQRVAEGRLNLASLGKAHDDQAIAALVEVRGIGVWTAQMFLMHALGRHDVWPVGDLGVRQGWALLMHQPVSEPAKLTSAADHLAPWRSSVAWYCWQAVDLTRAKARALPQEGRGAERSR